ncbi:MAG: AAA family ATPase [Pyrinomonadaceae bacterium]|nr:AAA family ATPase [Pyrinomonadaceae bacterium]
MILADLILTNYKCYDYFELRNLNRLAVFVGENDAGKTVLLDAIDLLVNAAACACEDFHQRPDETQCEECIIEGRFQLEFHDGELPETYRSGVNKDELYLRKKFRYDGGNSQITVIGTGFKEDRFNGFNGAANQKALLLEIGMEPGRNEMERRRQFEELKHSGKIELIEREISIPNFNLLAPYMPRVQRIRSAEYRTPDTMITQTLRNVVANVINPKDEDGIPHELAELAEVRRLIDERLHEEISKAKDTLRRAHPKLKNVRFEPAVDFTKAVTNACLSIDLGDGELALNAFGEGTKKRLWMGLLDWEHETAKHNVTGSVLRLYDEPDVNLHYEAQRQLFGNIHEIAEDESAHTQCFVCTHAVMMIDRAPSEAINLIRVDDANKRTVRRISVSPDAKEVVGFFHELGQAVGLSNTALLYERGFLLVEGRGEAVAIPIIYETVFKRKLEQDGLKLIPIHGCSAWESIMETLFLNRTDSVHLLLDSDCKNPGSNARITPATLAKMKCDESFIDKQVTFIGTKEFEDAFKPEVIALALNAQYPRADGKSWDVVEIAKLKESSDKFSRDLMDKVKHECPEHKSKASKTTFAGALAKQTTETNLPVKIREALLALRYRAGLGAVEVRSLAVNAD